MLQRAHPTLHHASPMVQPAGPTEHRGQSYGAFASHMLHHAQPTVHHACPTLHCSGPRLHCAGPLH